MRSRARIRFRTRAPLALFATAALGATVVAGAPSPAEAAGETVQVYLTTANLSQTLDQQSSLAFSSGAGSQSIGITINEGREFQKMVGFGATFTDSSAWLLHDKMSSGTRAAVMNDLFSYTGADGIGLSYLRQPMTATDYIKTVGGYYTYDDMPSGQTDEDLSEFTIAHDLDYLVPILQQALAVNPDIKVQFNAWTAPAWMKDNQSLVHAGNLLPQYRDEYAAYLIKAIQAYEAQGIPIWATSVLNEPATGDRPYPTMLLDTADNARITRDYLAPGLAAAGLSTRILAADDVEFETYYPTQVIDSDPAVAAEAPAIALHGYWGDHRQLSTLHGYYPNKDIYQVELSPNGNGCGYQPIYLLMDDVRNWAQTVVTWNVALDPSNGPFHTTAETSTCKPLVEVNPATGTVSYTQAYYQEGQFSKFVKPGAVRIDSNDNADVRNIAFKNPDGSKVFVAWNAASSSRTFSLNWGGQHVDYTLAPGSIATFTWSGTPTTDGRGWGDSTFGTSTNAYGGGLRSGSWSIADADTLSQTGLGGGAWPSIYFGYADHSDFTASARMTAVQAGTSASFPKYGMYACYKDIGNYMQAWIDPTSHNFVTHAVAKGTDLGWNNTALPSGFVATAPHTVSVTRTGDSFAFFLDGVQQPSRTAELGIACQLGLVTEDYKADFDDATLVDPLRWGSSRAGGNAGNIWGGGVKRGDWAISGPDSATITSQGTGWASVFRGYLAGDQTVSVQAQAVDPGSTSSFPKYGVYGAYADGNNYVQAFIDPTSDNYVTHVVVGGSDLGWVDTPLPAGFDEQEYHTISVSRSGNAFTFMLDGVAQGTRTAAIGNGQVGLVSEDHTANFRRFTVTSDAAAPAIDPNAWYYIVNRRSLRDLSVLNGATANSSIATIYEPVRENVSGQPWRLQQDQVWRIEPTGGGYYQIFNKKSGRALSVLSGGTANNTDAIIYDDINATDQFWQIVASPDGYGYVNFVNQRSGRLLSVYLGGTENANHAMIYDDVNATDQDWVLVPVRPR